ncbi:MAG: M1 family peptidase [Deltaproteobacteria bacterium]|nr:MAG: M1 family peptidase [Deltaproteobacteria bacterium]
MAIKILLFLIVFGITQPAAALSVHHNLKVRIYPQESRLTGIDDMDVRPEGAAVLDFILTEKAGRFEVMVNGMPADLISDHSRHRILLKPNERTDLVRVRLLYSAIFDDPVPIQPVSVDNPGYGVTATISEKGTLLLSGASWYPEIVQSRSTYLLQVDAPAGIISVTAGRSLGQQTQNGITASTWEIHYPTRGLSLSAAQYIVQEKTVGRIVAATYFFPESQYLAAGYLEATAQYLELYENLFGPYPFSKFAVVENFFPTGCGFSSYTLLGSRVLRLPFIVRTSLGHEIAHCWWGNGVYVDYAKGNWSEGLTTYVADYLFRERESAEAALEYRRQILRNYATLVRPEIDFPLRSFESRYSPSSKTIGYDKAAMVFHMLRVMLGEEAFWGALKDLYRERLFQVVSWRDIQKAFERRGKLPLQKFFNQWVAQAGAPYLTFKEVSSQGTGDWWQVRGQIIQKRPYYRLKADLLLETDGQKIMKTISLAGKVTAFEVNCNSKPARLSLDPNVNIFRRLEPSEIPPSINSLKGSSTVLVILADSLKTDTTKVLDILKDSLGFQKAEIVRENKVTDEMITDNDILLIGFPRRKNILTQIPEHVVLEKETFNLNGTLYNRDSDIFFGVFPHPFVQDRVVALFFPISSPYAETVARKITHYGKYSYLAFSNGRNRDKGIWPLLNSPLIHHW